LLLQKNHDNGRVVVMLFDLLGWQEASRGRLKRGTWR
jgi:hypothetical protein